MRLTTRTSTTQASVAARAGLESRGNVASTRGRGAAGARMLAGQEFATCSEDDFRAYIIGWTLVWSGIIPYTILAAKVGTSGSTITLAVYELSLLMVAT